MALKGFQQFQVVLVLLSVLISYQLVTSLRIAAFNVKIFGKTKVSDQEVLNILARIVRRYDMILIQEIRDKSETALGKLVDQVNKDIGVPNSYLNVTSTRLGRTNSKEQYSFIYRNASASVLATYQYPDPGDKFEREPFAVKFYCKTAALKTMVLVAIHVDPDVAVSEMNALVAVHDAVRQKFGSDNILIMGDLNADCSYASQSELDNLQLRTDSRFTWLIADDDDTTTSSTDCAYDRFVASGKELKANIVPDSAKVFRFDTAYQLDNAQTLDVSDHYPIELLLKLAVIGNPKSRLT